MALSTEKQILIEQRVANEAKSTGTAYLLWFFLGGLGAHRFYLGYTGSAAVMLLMAIAGILTAFIGVGFVLLLIVGLWALVDAFLIPGMIQKHKDNVRLKLSADMILYEKTAGS